MKDLRADSLMVHFEEEFTRLPVVSIQLVSIQVYSVEV